MVGFASPGMSLQGTDTLHTIDRFGFRAHFLCRIGSCHQREGRLIFAVCLVSHDTVGKHKATVQAGQIHEKTAGLLQCAIDTKIEELVESRGVLFSGMRPCSPRIRGQLEYSNVQTPPSKHQSLNHILGSRAGSCESNSTITLLSKPQAGA